MKAQDGDNNTSGQIREIDNEGQEGRMMSHKKVDEAQPTPKLTVWLLGAVL